MPQKWGLAQFADLRGAWQERGGGGVFEGGVDTPMHIMPVVLENNRSFVIRKCRKALGEKFSFLNGLWQGRLVIIWQFRAWSKRRSLANLRILGEFLRKEDQR